MSVVYIHCAVPLRGVFRSAGAKVPLSTAVAAVVTWPGLESYPPKP